MPPSDPLPVPIGEFDIYSFGTQECERSIHKSVVLPSKHEKWEEKLHETMGDNYYLLKSQSLGSLHLSIFVRIQLLPFISYIQSELVPTGVANVLNNKGGIGISFLLGSASFLFVNCHLTAHDRNVETRNADFNRIQTEMSLVPIPLPSSTPSRSRTNSNNNTPRIPLSPESPQPENETKLEEAQAKPINEHSKQPLKEGVSERFDYCFWFGDLNYRISGNRSVVEHLITNSLYEVLQANDQLLKQKKLGLAFTGFEEGEINFPPTYKFDAGSHFYDSSPKARIPSWTDRILWKMNSLITLDEYNSFKDVTWSDHKPVYAKFSVSIEMYNPNEISGQQESKVCTII